MTCETFEDRVLDYHDHQLSPAECAEVEAHLAACAECRSFARQLQQLDTALSRTLKTPSLQSAFSDRLRQRLQAETTVLSESQIMERKRQMETEFETGLLLLRRKSLRWISWSDGLACTWHVALAG